ncbi:hypothetical protein FTUN_8627 [Frigoriglobus tundricola]|uniref:Uncharacterized protein n=1 Tax=Frigoriglobus tundricola TaxID=2774151 RepID=A0A6M5Z3Z6_9BACT|nr:hypothetical protein FTUN_8627 [Frigoriglobus tundricola]
MGRLTRSNCWRAARKPLALAPRLVPGRERNGPVGPRAFTFVGSGHPNPTNARPALPRWS